jgi:hypothetical protein
MDVAFCEIAAYIFQGQRGKRQEKYERLSSVKGPRQELDFGCEMGGEDAEEDEEAEDAEKPEANDEA